MVQRQTMMIFFGWVLITFWWYIVYVKGILSGNNKPHPFSRAIRCVMTIVATLAQLTETSGLAIGIGTMTVIFQIIVIGFSYRHFSTTSLGRYDRLSGAFWLIAIGARLYTGSPLWSVYFLCLGDMIGFIPTIIKSRSHPQEEYLSVYITTIVKWLVNLLLLGTYTVVTALYPAYLVIINILFIVYTFLRKHHLKTK